VLNTDHEPTGRYPKAGQSETHDAPPKRIPSIQPPASRTSSRQAAKAAKTGRTYDRTVSRRETVRKSTCTAGSSTYVGSCDSTQCGTLRCREREPSTPSVPHQWLIISRSRVRSATIFFSRVFAPYSCFSRVISVGSSPAYFFFQLKQVAWLIPALRQISATGVPLSPCLMMNGFCASENLLAFRRFRSSPSQESVAKNSSFKRSSLWGSDQSIQQPPCNDLRLNLGSPFKDVQNARVA
jgi:hypothetical protein